MGVVFALIVDVSIVAFFIVFGVGFGFAGNIQNSVIMFYGLGVGFGVFCWVVCGVCWVVRGVCCVWCVV